MKGPVSSTDVKLKTLLLVYNCAVAFRCTAAIAPDFVARHRMNTWALGCFYTIYSCALSLIEDLQRYQQRWLHETSSHIPVPSPNEILSNEDNVDDDDDNIFTLALLLGLVLYNLGELLSMLQLDDQAITVQAHLSTLLLYGTSGQLSLSSLPLLLSMTLPGTQNAAAA
jgi:hypothetical protein